MKAKVVSRALVLGVLAIAGCKLSRPPQGMKFTYQPQGLCQGIAFQFPLQIMPNGAYIWSEGRGFFTHSVNGYFEVKVAATYNFWAPPPDVPIPYQFTVTCLPGGTPLSSAWPGPGAILHVTEDATQPSKLKLEYIYP